MAQQSAALSVMKMGMSLELRSVANLDSAMVVLMGSHLVEMLATQLVAPTALLLVD